MAEEISFKIRESELWQAVSDNGLDLQSLTRRFTFLPVLNGTFAVDSFFLLSGLLVSYLSLRKFEKFGKLPLVQFYMHRYIRLTPIYLFVILFFTYVSQLFGDGPFFRLKFPHAAQNCKDYWWTNILYVNNFYPKEDSKQCIGWTWYLANDMQFYIISPIILYIMYKFALIGTIVVNGIICVGSFVVIAVLIEYYRYWDGNPQELLLARGPGSFFHVVYIKPYCRIPPYLIGLALGYILHHKMKPRGLIKWIIVIIGWCCAIIFGLSVIYGIWKEVKEHPEHFTKADNIAYGTFSRFTWGLALAWVIYACHSGYGGLVNEILSWKGFIPLGRLTYGAYLLHILVIHLYHYTMQTTHHYKDLQASFEYVSIVGISYMAAFILAIWIEFPVANIEKLVLHVLHRKEE